MPDHVQIRTRRSALTEKVQREVRETVVLRNEVVVAVLPEGDPLVYVLHLPTSELLELQESLRPVLDCRPQLRSLLEALIQYRRQRRRKSSHGGPNGGWQSPGRGREALR
jgi:hypothetical protein